MRGERALAILQNTISPRSSAASIDQSRKDLDIVKSQLSGSLAPSQIYPSTFFALANCLLFNGATPTWTKTLITSASHALGAYWKNDATAANDGDEYTVSMPLAAGEYYLDIYYAKDSGGGKFDVYLDGVLISSGTDMYNASNAYNSTYSQAFTCASSGSHTVMLKINGKNASSADYNVYLTYVQIYPSA